MANLNKVFLIGNLTRDIELRSTQSGTQIAKFGMAINRRWRGQDGSQQESTCFVDLTAFGRQAETLGKYVRRGSPLFVEGRLEYSTWQGQDGTKRSKLSVVVENFQFLGGGQSQGGRQGGGSGEGFGGASSGPSGTGGTQEGGFGEWGEGGEIPF